MSENPPRADYQQERSKDYWRGYIVGLTDGEGSFHIAFQIRDDLPMGISIIPEFHISQNATSAEALEKIRTNFGCGYIKPNHRNSQDNTFVYVVRDRYDLLTKIIPFFEVNKLITNKKEDFISFAEVVRFMEIGSHRTNEGVRTIIDLAYQMNGGGSRRIRKKNELINLLKSSETARKTRK